MLEFNAGVVCTVVECCNLKRPVLEALTDGTPVDRVPLLGAWGGRAPSWERAVSGQVLGAVGPPQRRTSVRSGL